MRINIYAEEMTNETELVVKEVTDAKFGTRTFYGLRFYLQSPDVLHADPEDDDRSAVTLWIPWTRKGGHQPGVIMEVLDGLNERMEDAMDHEGWELTK